MVMWTICSKMINSYYESRVRYVLDTLSNSTPGKRYWQTLADGQVKYWKESSTFPWWIKFAYQKKPKNWHLMTIEEKNTINYGFNYNTKDIIRILNKTLNNKKLTIQQGLFVEQLFINLNQEENDYFYQNKTSNDIDMTSCPF